MSQRLVDGYLRDLREDLRDLPKSRQNELVAEIKEHIDIALAEEAGNDEATVRNVLERLGDPADIASEARDRMGIPPARAGFRETAAVILLPIGGVIIPFLGWIVGLVLLWSSPVWTTRDKWIGTLIIPGGLMLPVYLFITPSQVCSTFTDSSGQVISSTCSDPSGLSHILLLVAFALMVAAPIVTAIYLARRASTLSNR
jgi:uncharacterized membrane protein